MKVLNTLLGVAERIALVLASVCMLLIMTLTTFDLLSRKFLGFSISSLFEFTEDYLMVGLVFLTLSYVYSVGGHVRVALFDKIIPEAVKRVWNPLQNALAFLLFALIAVEGWNAAVEAYQFNERSNSLLAYPLAPALLMVPIGSVMLCLRILQSFFDDSTQQDTHDIPEIEP